MADAVGKNLLCQLTQTERPKDQRLENTETAIHGYFEEHKLGVRSIDSISHQTLKKHRTVKNGYKVSNHQ